MAAPPIDRPPVDKASGGRPVYDLLEREEVRDGLLCYIQFHVSRSWVDWPRGMISDVSQDLFQEVVRRALANETAYRPNGQGLAWLKKVALHLIYNTRRKLRHPARPRCGDGCFDLVSKTVHAAKVDDSTWLGEFLDLLKPRHRDVIVLHYLFDLDHRSVAERLDLTSAKSSNDLTCRAMRELRAVMGLRVVRT